MVDLKYVEGVGQWFTAEVGGTYAVGLLKKNGRR